MFCRLTMSKLHLYSISYIFHIDEVRMKTRYTIDSHVLYVHQYYNKTRGTHIMNIIVLILVFL